MNILGIFSWTSPLTDVLYHSRTLVDRVENRKIDGTFEEDGLYYVRLKMKPDEEHAIDIKLHTCEWDSENTFLLADAIADSINPKKPTQAEKEESEREWLAAFEEEEANLAYSRAMSEAGATK